MLRVLLTMKRNNDQHVSYKVHFSQVSSVPPKDILNKKIKHYIKFYPNIIHRIEQSGVAIRRADDDLLKVASYGSP